MAENQIELYTPKFYGMCAIGGALACGVTHAAMTPVDLVKCRLQTGFPYRGVFHGFSSIYKEEGLMALTRGWAPTLIGYSMQGMCKFGFYEFFKKLYSDMAGDEETAHKYRTVLYMGASASAEILADIALCPMEALKVRVQTDQGFAKGLMDGLPKMIQQGGAGVLFKGLVPLWARQVPYTIMKFTAFERVVESIYKYAMSKPKHEYTKMEQLGVTFVAGYIAGVFCAIVSHPADVIVSKLNKAPGASIGGIARELGWAGCWSGLMPRIFMIGTLTALQWFIYDSFKVYVGLPTSGAQPTPAAVEEITEKKD